MIGRTLVCLVVAAGCACQRATPDHQPSPPASSPPPATPGAMKIDRTQAIEIARRDAQTAYRDLSPYDIVAIEKDGQWRVTFVLKDKESQGGGAQYLISGDGQIVSKRYYQ
jgi:hypothetical protein